MLHHVSIPARDPERVASVLAEVMGGKAYPFPGTIPDSYIAMSGDGHGTAVEVYPETTILIPGVGEQPGSVSRDESPNTYWPFHFYMSVPLSMSDIERIGKREGWRTKLFGRGAPGEPPLFHVIEFWVENRLGIEFVTTDMLDEYMGLMQFKILDAVTAANDTRAGTVSELATA